MASNWKEWDAEQLGNFKKIDDLVVIGHTRHCACRQVWGDGYCECRKGLNEERNSQD
jgi:hypothetical protein